MKQNLKHQRHPNILAVLAALSVLALPLSGWAQFTFSTNNGTIDITGYTGTGGNVTVPSTTNGYTVTAIYPYGLSSTLITGVTLPNTLIYIYDYAFWDCSSLTSVTIPGSVSYIGSGVCESCSSLTNITVNSDNAYYTNVDGVLFNKAMTTLLQYPGGRAGDYAIPTGVTSIGVAFFGCANLTSLTIPNTATNLPDYALEGCSSLASVTFPGNLASIGNQAFAYCSSLPAVSIPASVTNIGDRAFYYCPKLTNIAVNAANSAYTSTGPVLFNKAMTKLIESVWALSGGYTVSNTVTSISSNAFMDCPNLNSVTIPANVTNVGNYAFKNCYGLRRAYFLGNAPTVDGVAGSANTTVFQGDNTGTVGYTSGTTGWASTFGGWPTSLYSEYNCIITNGAVTITGYIGSGGNVTIPSSISGYPVTTIGVQAFDSCPILTNVTIPNSVTSIGVNAFVWCTNLMSVLIGTGVTNIGTSAFGDCSSLKSVAIPDSVITIGTDVFGYCIGLTNVTIGNHVAYISDSAFEHCSNLVSVVIGNGVTNIGDFSFYYCTRLMSVTIPDSVATIGGDAFNECSGLTSVTIGNGVSYIDVYAFASCGSLSQIYFRGNTPGQYSDTFDGTPATVYYVPGTTGWGSTYAGLPTAPWYQPQPQILGSAYGLGVISKAFNFTISWATNTAMVVEASTNLQDWTPVITNTLVNGTNYFSDSSYTNYPKRFYRVRSQ